MVAHKNTSSPEELFEKISKIYNTTPEQARSLTKYHATFRSELGSLLRSAGGAAHFEVREGDVSRGVGFIAKIVSFFTGGLADLFASAVRGVDKYGKESDLDEVQKIATAISGNSAIHQFSKALATKSLESQVDALKTLSPQEAIKYAKKDIQTLKEKIIAGEFENGLDESEASSLLGEDHDASDIIEDLQEDMWKEIGLSRGRNFLEKECKATLQELKYEDGHPNLGSHTADVIAAHQEYQGSAPSYDAYEKQHPKLGTHTAGVVDHHRHDHMPASKPQADNNYEENHENLGENTANIISKHAASKSDHNH
jgi:hypothetical protein